MQLHNGLIFIIVNWNYKQSILDTHNKYGINIPLNEN